LFLLIKGGVLRRNPGNALVSVIYIYIFADINQSINYQSINQLFYVFLVE